MRGPESHQPGEIHFHYNRDEREASLPDEVVNRRRMSFWSRNRHLMLIFMDILIITTVALFLLPHIRGVGEKELAGYHLKLKVTLFDGTILTSLRAEADEKAVEGDFVLIIKVQPEGRESRHYGILSPGGSENIIRGRIPFHAGDTSISAELRIGDQRLTLNQVIPRE